MKPLPARERIVGTWNPSGLLRPRPARHPNTLQLGGSVIDLYARLRLRPELWTEYLALVGEEVTEASVDALLAGRDSNFSDLSAVAASEWIGSWIDKEFSATPTRQSDLRKAVELTKHLLTAGLSPLNGYAAVTVGRASLFLGLLFLGPEAERLLDVSEPMLLRVLDEEFLEDGGHRSCSPMWQALHVEGFLDCLNLAGAFPRRFRPQLLERLREQLPILLGWLRRITQPDGSLAYFHDTTLGVSAFPGELIRYAESLGVFPDHRRGHDGIVRLECMDSLLLMDTNSSGLHSSQHDAMFSFEWAYKGYRRTGNPGISTWEDDTVRARELSAPGHSVLEVDGQAHSSNGGLFRKPRPARRMEIRTDHQSFVECAHDGYARLLNPLLHRRRIEVHADSLRVIDTLEGKGRHKVRLWFPFRPKVRPTIIPDAKMEAKPIPAGYSAGFRTVLPSETILCSWEGNCPTTFTTVLPGS